jgi:hypothetical protein
MFLGLEQAPYDMLTLPNTASYLIFVNVSFSSLLIVSGVSCELVDESTSAVLDSVQLPVATGNFQVSLSGTDSVTAGTAVEVTCASATLLVTVQTAGIAAIQF